ncbi:MAG: hypothetical protein ACTTKI_08265 [Tannerella sp.]|uniref:hypothetical protein n=1 Tax=Tannerella sp. TaxID=2382127 RepID=UPI003FA30D14
MIIRRQPLQQSHGQLSIVMPGTRCIRTPPIVIPNAVRNPTSNALGVRPWASGGEPTEQRAGRKKIRLSERSELPDFPTCERREVV